TIDQTIANTHGQDTILSSLQLGVEAAGNYGNCNWGYACAYTNCISWSTPTQPLPPEVNPRVVFERLFGDGTSAEERRRDRRQSAHRHVRGQHPRTGAAHRDRHREFDQGTDRGRALRAAGE